ncbi:glycosyltransferase family 9 protein [Flavobacterium cellulosilyticum]|uniref:Lipopolysaccharide heptosyltransferase family protein n=1 Tax=Flavobacterium cellulosilyticum TaxID=2541731 RepID=A0A4R5CNL3_9FLAO|nr:glycosyltransferase family 9 protein [Flavobacterium cellulosilyticum]TDD99174.1 lipopolysaccharide heptosyltransferase family protein [Flavobacterium cellulosilyticum]
MKLLSKINPFRRVLTAAVFGNIGKNNIGPANGIMDPSQIKRVLISRPNHRLGNLLLITPLVQEVSQTFPNCTIDIFVKGNMAPIVFENYTNIGQIIKLPKKHFDELSAYLKGWVSLRKQKYDLAINVEQNSSSGRLSIKLANSKYKFFGGMNEEDQSKYDNYGHIAKQPVYNLRNYLAQFGIQSKDKIVPSLLIKLSQTELKAAKEKLDLLVPATKKTIGIFTFATGAKCYSVDWWAVFYERLLKQFPDYNILEILPVENVSQLGFKAPSFYSKDIREITAFFANTAIFIGADSGMMHLASAAQIPTLGLFSVTVVDKYKPYNPGSCAIQTNQTDLEDWMKTIHEVLKNN